MAAIAWTDVRGFVFDGSEARDASDFSEVLREHGLEPDDAFDMFRDEEMSVGKRLFFAEKCSEDALSAMLFRETDERVLGVVKRRLDEARLERDGGIVR